MPETGDTAPGAWITIARIVRPRGRDGEVIAEVLTDFPHRFEKRQRVYAESAAGLPQPLMIAEAWWHGDRLILRFEGVASIAEADQLRGRALQVPREERIALGADQFYLSDLIGCEVVRDGERIGKVVRVEPTGGADLLCVQPAERPDESSEILIPFAREICTEIDITARRIMIKPPEGLLELNRECSGRLQT
jgi:16S rRNA processing protein RimM